jgi:hypothetical protein
MGVGWGMGLKPAEVSHGLTPEHEARHRVFQFDPGLYARAAERACGVKLAAAAAVSELSVDLTETRPVERRADTILRARLPGRGRGPIVIIESQTREDRSRRRRWPYYIAFVRDKYRCQVLFMVVCSSAVTARWARQPIEVGEPGAVCMVVTPLVLGPDNVRMVTTIAEAVEDLPFAVLSALVHRKARGKEKDAILGSLAAALETIDVGTAAELGEFTEVGLGDTAAGEKWRTMMASGTYEFASEQRKEGRTEGRQEGRTEGEAKGKAEFVLENLKDRGIPVDPHSAARIMACTDAEALGAWRKRSLTVDKVADLFTS